MKELDYDKIISVMEFLDWKWYTFDEPKVPNKKEIKKHCKYLFKKSVERWACSSGWFDVSIEDWIVEVQFVLDYSYHN